MKRWNLVAVVCVLALLAAAVPAAMPVAADPGGTTSLTITRYDFDGTTVLDTVTLNVTQMQSLTVQGDGSTHYYMQGPTFDPDNLWDLNETENLKDKGALKGTDLADLCDLVGMNPTDEVEVVATDDFSETFAYDDVYDPEPEQGKMVVCWWKDGDYVPTYADGMQLVFFAETTNGAGQYVFGNWDMHETLPEENHHYFGDYPSSNGLSVKYIDRIRVYSHEWDVTLDGASTYVMDQTEFEEGVACHEATWDDGGDIWSGIPLWRLVGYVDDEEQHDFNDALAAQGYDVKVTAVDDYNKSFNSTFVARNDDMIVANTLNGEPLPGNKFPLRLVGPGLSGSQKVGQIAKIELVGLPAGDTSASLDATTNVVLPMVGIGLDRDSIDYGDVGPGDDSAEETVNITNVGTTDVDVTLVVIGTDTIAQEFYELSLYLDSLLYNPVAVIAHIPVPETEDVVTQLHVPSNWNHGGAQEAEFIFWAGASP
jgi:hypothetical protein